MNEITPSPEFEQKVRAAAAAPSADPEFVRRLRARVISTGAKAGSQPSHTLRKPTTRGIAAMRNRMIIPALLAVLSLAVVAFFMLRPTSNVSAQQILDRAAAAQSAAAPAQGIWHTRVEIYHDLQPVGGNQPATRITDDRYTDLASGRNRYIMQDASGKLTQVNANDGSFEYTGIAADSGPLTVYRAPADQSNTKMGLPADSAASEKALFDWFRSNPRVKLEGKQTRPDGSQAYVLADQNYQTQKMPDGQVVQTYTGSMKMIFDAQTYRLLETETTVRKDGKDIVIDAARFLVDEVLPADSSMTWDLSDLKGITIVDESTTGQNAQDGAPQVETLSEHELAARAQAYVLKTVPAGFTLKIVAVANQPKDQPYAYEVNYTGAANESFGMQCIGKLDPGFVEANFYDGSYKAANGMVLYYSPSSSATYTSAMLAAPDGTGFLIGGTFPREKFQALIEDLVPAK